MRRLNVKLTLWLVGITLFSVVGVHFLHAYQLDKNADFLRVQAEQAHQDGNNREAVKQYNQYLKHRDDPAGYSVLAELVVDIAKDTDATRQDKQRAYTILEEAIRRHPELDDVRRRLVDYTMQMGRFTESLEHIQYLNERGEKSTDLDFKMAKCYLAAREEEKAVKKLYALVGLDETTGQFSADPPPGAKEPAAFELLARILHSKPDGAQKADALMTQLVAWNDSAKAHLARANYLHSTAAAFKPGSAESKETDEQAKAELDRAFESESEDADVILAAAVYALSQKDFPKAQELLDRALKEHPDRQDVYLRLAQLKVMQNDIEGSVEHLKLGLKQASDINLLLERLVDLQFQLGDLEAARATCKQMRDRGTFAPELIRFEDARIKYAEGDFLAASREFEAARPSFVRNSNSVYAQQLDILLGHCYELLGQWDRELELYRGVLQKFPDMLRPRLGEAVALQNLGRHDEATASVNLLAVNAKKIPYIRAQVLQLLINDQMQKPEADRDWSSAEGIAEMLYEDESRSDLENTLLKADLLILQNQPEDAQKLLTAACKKHPKEPRAWTGLARLLSRDKENEGKITQILARAEKEVGGESFPLRVERVRVALRQGGSEMPAELKKLEQGLDKFSEQERLSLMTQLGAAYMQARDYAGAKRCWEYAIEHDPKNAPVRQFLFELAFDSKDEATMHDVVKGLHDSPYFGPQSPLYKYCAAAAILFPINAHKKDKPGPMSPEERTALAEARKLIDEAIAVRAEWSVLWRVKGEIEQIAAEPGSVARAITNYQRALDCSHTGQTTVARRLVQLLYASNRISEANDVLKYAGQSADTSDVWKRTVEDIIFKGGDVDSALSMAERDAEADPKSPANHVWYGQFLERAGRTDEAEAAYRKAVEAGPEMPQTWELLVRRLVASKKQAEATEAVREAAEALPKTPAALAKLYQYIGDNAHAEHFYKAAVEQRPDDLMSVAAIVEFYFNTNQSAQAIPYLDQIIQKTAKSTNKLELQQLASARRFKAQIIASPGDYEHVVAATKLIEENTRDGVLGPEDTQAIVLMLAIRQEPDSRVKAMQLLESLQERRPLQPREQSVLGQLYDRAGKWDKSRDLMLSAVTRRSDDLDILFPFAQMLIRHGEFDDATRWVDRLDELVAAAKVPVSNSIKQSISVLRARILVQNGQKEQAANVLENLLPRPLPQSQLRLLGDVAKLMEELELHDAAEKLLAEYVSQEPRGMAAMAAFTSRRGDVDKAFELLEQARKSQPTSEILPIALEALRRHPDKMSPERFKLLEGWAKTSAEEESNSQQIKMLLAELYDLEGRSQDAIQIYREMLIDTRTDATEQALVKNNLAFMLATNKGRPDSAAEAVRLVGEAMRTLGPTADLLDTRALAYLAQGKTQQAISDLDVAAADSPSGSKFFHLALAQKQAHNLDSARQWLAKAQQSGIENGQLGTTELKLYKQLVDDLK